MDVKVGSGAFMPTLEKSVELAEGIVQVGNGARMRTAALLTDMNQVLRLVPAMPSKSAARSIT